MGYENILGHAAPRRQIGWGAQVGGVNPDHFAPLHCFEAKPKFDHQLTTAQIPSIPLLLIGDGRFHAVNRITCGERAQGNMEYTAPPHEGRRSTYWERLP